MSFNSRDYSSGFPERSARIFDALTEISTTIEIKSLSRVDRESETIIYIDFELDKKLRELPREIQEKYLCWQLGKYLIAYYFQGLINSKHLENFELEEILENRSGLGSKSSLFQALENANSGSGFFDRDWSIVSKENNGLWAVTKQELMLYVKPDIHLSLQERDAKIGDLVSILMPNHLVEKGGYIAIGNSGNPATEEGQLINIYLNIDATGATSFLRSLTERLNHLFIPFSCRFLYDADRYDRIDTGIITLIKADYPIVESILQEIYQQHEQFFRAEIPLFTKFLERGIAIAELPQETNRTSETFANSRFQVIVEGLFATWQQGNNSSQSRLTNILDRFTHKSIDINRPYLEADSEDIYLPW